MAGKGSGGRKRGHDAHDPSIVTCDSGGNNDDDNDGDDDGDGQGGGGNGDDDERGRYPDLSTARDPCDPARDPSYIMGDPCEL